MKKILVSLGLILTLVLCCAFVPVNAAEECAHKEWKFEYYLDGEDAPANCKESRIAKYSCKKCDEVQYKKVYGDHEIEFKVGDLSCTEAQTVTETCKVCKEVIKVSEVTPALGHSWKETALDASCERGAGVAKVCEACGAEKDFVAWGEDSELYAPALGHKWENTKVVKATCKEGGYTLQTCKNCKETQKVDVTEKDPVNGHVAVKVSTLKEPGCKTNGVGKFKCELCDTAEWYGSIPAEHKYVVTPHSGKAATCGKDGKGDKKCSVCGDTVKNVVIPATGNHTWGPEGTIDATCTQPDKYGKVCTTCGKEDAVKVEGSVALGHDWAEVFKDASCELASGIYKECTRCDVTDYVEFEEDHPLYAAALGHKAVTVKGYAATCSKVGKTDGSKCEVCGKTLVAQKDIAKDKNAHTPVLVGEPLKAPGCTTLGVGKYKCSGCNKDLGYSAIPAAHTWDAGTPDKGKAPTCGKDGYGTFKCLVEGCKATKKDVIPATGDHNVEENAIVEICGEKLQIVNRCTVCKKVLEVVSEGAVVEHNWSEDKVYPATCLTQEFVGRVCLNEDCPVGLEVIKVLAPANGHDYEEEFVGATCDKPSGIARTCKLGCKLTAAEKNEYFEEGHPLYEAPKGHKAVTVKAVAPTCSATGLTEGSKCEVCGTVLVKQQVVAKNPNNHTKELVGAPLREATCTKTGVGKYGCKDCDADLGYGVIPAAHSYGAPVAYTGKEATCGKAGLGVKVCSVCGDEVKDVVIPATGAHTWADLFLEETCTSPAKTGEACSVCFAEKDVEVVEGSKALGHEYVETYKDADCTNASGILVTCERCDYKNFKPFTAADGDLYAAATGHKAQTVKAVAATCKKTGLTEGSKCKTCGEILVKQQEVAINPNAHTKQLVGEPLRAKTCTKSGVGKYGCKDCGADLGYGVIEASHEYGAVIAYEGKEATCGKAGEGYKVCTVCGHKVEKVAIKATGNHTWNENGIIDATCTEAAKVGKICEVCHALDKNVVSVGEPNGHTWKEIPVDADCETPAGVKRVCTVCDAEEFEAYKGELAEAAKGHKLEKVTVAGTCKAKGYTADVCKTCKKEFNKVEGTIDPNNHKPVYDEENILRAPTCTKTGVAKATCEYCGEGLGYVAMPARHSYVASDIANETGTLVYHKCADCDYIKVIAYFGDKGVKAGDVFKSIEAFEKAEAAE